MWVFWSKVASHAWAETASLMVGGSGFPLLKFLSHFGQAYGTTLM